MMFTDAELDYLACQPLGRLATDQPGLAPPISPVGFVYNDRTDTVDPWRPARWRYVAPPTPRMAATAARSPESTSIGSPASPSTILSVMCSA